MPQKMLPEDVLLLVLGGLDTTDLFRCSQACRWFYNIITHNNLLLTTETSLIAAANAGHLDKVKQIIAIMGITNTTTDPEFSVRNQWQVATMRAAGKGRTNVVTLLLEYPICSDLCGHSIISSAMNAEGTGMLQAATRYFSTVVNSIDTEMFYNSFADLFLENGNADKIALILEDPTYGDDMRYLLRRNFGVDDVPDTIDDVWVAKCCKKYVDRRLSRPVYRPSPWLQSTYESYGICGYRTYGEV